MHSAAIIIPILCNGDKGENESISAMSGGQSFKARGHLFLLCKGHFIASFPSPLACESSWMKRWVVSGDSQSAAWCYGTQIYSSYCLCFFFNWPLFYNFFPQIDSYFSFFYSNRSEHISTATCPGRCSLERPTGVRINTRRT